MQAALFVASGTQGNLLGLLAHCGRGDEILVGDRCHIYNSEAGGASALGGIAYHPIATAPDGTLPVERLRAAVRDASDSHAALTRLVCLENTHNSCGGVVLPPAYMAEVRAFADSAGLRVHLDGARVFNAAVALGEDVRAITRHVDSVQFCLSKGLSAPVGSIIAGDAALVARARRWRKMVGGGMRQAGVIAAAGIVALETMVGRLAEDHANARMLAEGLASFPQVQLDLATVQTDIVYFDVRDERITPQAFVAGLRERGVLVGSAYGTRIRAVTHYGIDSHDIEAALDAAREVLAG
jgi:threonine aldolase